jgi:flagellar basal body-associated protein FliL
MEQKIETKKNSAWPIILILIVLVVLVGAWYFLAKKPVTPVSPVKTEEMKPVERATPTPKEDSVSAIDEDLSKIEVFNLDQEFQEIDQDLNSL